jgi:hypothetical protein
MSETKRIVIGVFVFVGAQELQAWEVPADWGEPEIDALVWESACEYAESYGVYNPGETTDWDDLDAWEKADYAWSQVEGWWAPYDSVIHDGLLLCGNDTEVQWNTTH